MAVKEPPAAPSPVVVDPRMRSRRIGVRREAGRKRLQRLTYVLAGVAVVVLGLAALRSPLLDVDRVTVTGARHTGPGEVRRAAGVERGDPLIGVDAGAAARRIEALPWVARAQVSRAWPSTVTVRVTERTPVAQVRINAGRVAVVDAGGRVLAFRAVAPPPPAGARPGAGPPAAGSPVILTGVHGRLAEGGRLPADARAALRVAVAARDRLPGVLASVDAGLDATLAEGGVVRFGSAKRLEEKLTALKTVLDQVDTGCLATLDVRVPGSTALTRHQGCS
ncbi:MAG TPA: FtsQ-type POTRA domain-containing protein [Acidimicrobiales bacterium]|nr:FtsQ-type POTRA domain-containing protein [Acidimicrobiales bacterium]